MLPAVEIGTWYWTNLKFFGLVVVGRIIWQRVFPCTVCGTRTGNVRCSTKPSRSRFEEMVRFLLFDVKSEGCEKLFHDKFSLISTLWNTLRTLSKHMHMVNTYITIHEQLLPCTVRCRFMLCVLNKPENLDSVFGWMSMLRQSTSAMAFFIREKTRAGILLSDYQITYWWNMKPMQLLFKIDCIVTCHRYRPQRWRPVNQSQLIDGETSFAFSNASSVL